jgi:L-lactate utilization protein LutC
MNTAMTKSKLIPNMTYAQVASEVQIERVVQALQANNINVVVTDNGEAAKAKLFEIIPPGAEVFTGLSVTLDTLGIPAEINQRYDSVRAKLDALDPQTPIHARNKLGATPEYIVGSVHAVSEDGAVVIASGSGNQLAGYAAGAAHVIWLVGAQKIVPNLDEAMKRVYEYSYPLEDERMLRIRGMNAYLAKLLIVRGDMPGRITMILIKENLGF